MDSATILRKAAENLAVHEILGAWTDTTANIATTAVVRLGGTNPNVPLTSTIEAERLCKVS